MSEGLDQRIRSAVTELVETSPPPHPAERVLKSHTAERRPLSLRAGLARMAIAAVAVLLVGLAGAWIGRSTAPPDAANTPDVPIVEGTLGPEPEFDPAAAFGAVETPLAQAGGELAPEVSTDTESVVGALEGDFKAVGGIPGTELEVFRWETDRNQTCKQVVGEDVRSTGCVDELTYGSDPYNPDGNSLGTFDMTDRSVDGTVVVWGVTEDTAVVVADTGAEVIWQRPRAAMVAFSFDTDISAVTLRAYDAGQELLADTEFSPEGETEIAGAAEDLTMVEDSHPVAELWAATGTIPEFSDVLDSAGYNFTCGAGGVPPWAVCLVAADDLLLVVPIEGAAGQTLRISDSGLVRDVVVPLDQEELIGIANMRGGGVRGVVEYSGEETGGLSAPSLVGPEGD